MGDRIKTALVNILAIIGFLIVFGAIYYFLVYNQTSRSNTSTPAQINYDIINSIDGPTATMSWNTKDGRLYAGICDDRPPKGCTCGEKCMTCDDKGTFYYDSQGKLIINCYGLIEYEYSEIAKCDYIESLIRNVQPDYADCKTR